MASEESIAAGATVWEPRRSDSVAEAERQFREEVLPEEFDYVRNRRASHGLGGERELLARRGVANDLTGVALSGGGIRSATFNLGLLQAMSRRGLFKWVDYLSTVSGGGFIGSSLTALLSEGSRKKEATVGPGARGAAAVQGAAGFPFPDRTGADEAETVKYLRAHSDYLAPQGLTDYLRAFALLARGIALNLVLLVPALMIVSLMGAFVSTDELVQATRQAGMAGSVEPYRDTGPRKAPPGTRRWLYRGPEASAGLPALSYGAAEGLQAWGLFGSSPATAEAALDLWTGGSAITAATVSPDPLRRPIAAAAQDGSLWLFFPDRLVGGLRPESRRVLAGASASTRPPWTRLAFSTDSCLLTGWPAPGAPPTIWRIGRNPDPGTGFCEPTFALEALEPGSEVPSDLAPGGASRPLASAPVSRLAAWNPHRFHLPMTGGSLLLLLAVFVGLYPFAALLAGPLGRSVNGLAGAVRRSLRALRGMLRRGDDLAPKQAESGRHRGMTLSRRIAGSALLAVPLFGLVATSFDTPEGGFSGYHRFFWPVVGVALMGLWWLLSTLFLAPVLRGWRSPRRKGSEVRSTGSERLRCTLVLLLPGLVLLALPALLGKPALLIPVPDEPVWRTPPLWLLMAGWWLGCLALLLPVMWPGRKTAADTPEQLGEWRRRLAGRVYAASHLALWIFLAQSAFHPLPQELVGSLVQAVLTGFGVGEAVSRSSLTALTLLGFYAGVQYLAFWKAFAWLARGGRAAAAAEAEAGGDGVGSSAPAAAASSPIVWRERYEKAFSYALLALAAVALFEVQPYVVYHFHRFTAGRTIEWLYYAAAIWFLAIVLAANLLQTLRGVGKTIALLCLGILGPLLPVLVYLFCVDALVYGEGWFDLRWALFGQSSTLIAGARLSFYVVTGAVAAYLIGKLVDANATGMHGFYRDRLSQGYLVGVDRDGVLGPEDELSLREICPEGSGAPYHLINASLNMQRESAGALRWRNSDFFVFSRHWCGGPHSEYCRTEDLEHVAPGVHLGSAMAVSGAAAAPNRGAQTSGFLVMLMTLLNVRLGLWLPTPRRVRRLARLGMLGAPEGAAGRLRRWWLRLRNRPSGYYLVDEMASRLDASGPYVNLSDGGHLENTGAYELLRRRCRLVIVSDAEADPEMSLGALAALMRFASIDLGIQIDIDPEPLRLGKHGTSAGHWAVGEIRYPPISPGGKPETGRLLYVKASVDGEESEVIREYRARNPGFPQESTADQVFEEDQFEAYRALGFHIGGKLFAALRDEALAEPADIEAWLTELSRASAVASS